MSKKCFIVVGLAYGDEGKGATTEFLTRRHKADLIVRYNGGAQAAHNVVEKSGRHHTFSQFGSGMLQPNVKTHLSRFVIVNPLNMAREATHLIELGIYDIWNRTTVDGNALIVTPFQIAINRLQELSRGQNKHGSCGMGIGQTRSDHIEYGDKVLFAKDLKNKFITAEKLEFLRKVCLEKANQIKDRIKFSASSQRELLTLTSDRVVGYLVNEYEKWPAKVVNTFHLQRLLEESEVSVFEGAQGVLLDESFGTAPCTTWTKTTCENALQLLEDAMYNSMYKGTVHKTGCLRTYLTRHGNGPFVTEDNRLSKYFSEPHNVEGYYQGKFRVGYFDAQLIKYSLWACHGVDSISLSHLDEWNKDLGICVSHNPLVYCNTKNSGDYVKMLQEILGVPITLIGTGPCYEDRMEVSFDRETGKSTTTIMGQQAQFNQV